MRVGSSQMTNAVPRRTDESNDPSLTESETMSTQATNSKTTPSSAVQLEILGDECARKILVATSDGPKTAKELAQRTDRSSATVYRRINNLLESELVSECIRFDETGSHVTAYEATIDTLSISIHAEGIDVSVHRREEPS